MKHLIMLVILTFFFAIHSAEVMPGAALGLNIANLTAKGEGLSLQMTSKTGFAGGVIIDISVNEMISVIPGLGYNMKGSKMELFVFSASTNINYLSIPVMVVAKFNGGSVRPFVEIGPELGILMSATDKAEGGGESSTKDSKNDYTSTDFDLNFGAGLEMPMVGFIPFVQIIFSQGLSNIAKDASSGTSLKTSGILIQVGAKVKM